MCAAPARRGPGREPIESTVATNSARAFEGARSGFQRVTMRWSCAIFVHSRSMIVDLSTALAGGPRLSVGIGTIEHMNGIELSEARTAVDEATRRFCPARGAADASGCSPEVSASPTARRSVAEWVEVVATSQAMINQLGAVQAAAIAEIAATESVHAEDGTIQERSRGVGHIRLDAAALVAGPLGATDAMAQRRVSLAVREVRVMPSLHHAMAAGLLDGWRAGLVGEELFDAPDHVAGAVSASVVDQLPGRSGAEVRRRVRCAVAKVDEQWLRQRVDRARRDRSVRRWAHEPGVDAWFGTFPAERSALAWAAVDDVAQRYRKDGSCETLDQARADAMLDLVLGRATARFTVQLTVPALIGDVAEPAAGSVAPRAGTATGTGTGAVAPSRTAPFRGTLSAEGDTGGPVIAAGIRTFGERAERVGTSVVHAPTRGSGGEDEGASRVVERGADGPSLIAAREQSAALASEVLKWLQDHDGFIEVRGLGGTGTSEVPTAWVAAHVFVASTRSPRCSGGQPIELVRSHPVTGALLDLDDVLRTESYRPSAALIRFVRARDGHCRFPGCTVAARFCDLDHVRPWPFGATHAGNLVLLCRRHHRVKQSPGWRALLRDDGSMLWCTPDGRSLTSDPIDHRQQGPLQLRQGESCVGLRSSAASTGLTGAEGGAAATEGLDPAGRARGAELRDRGEVSRRRNLDAGPFSRLEHAQEHLLLSTGGQRGSRGQLVGIGEPLDRHRFVPAITVSSGWSRCRGARPLGGRRHDTDHDLPPF